MAEDPNRKKEKASSQALLEEKKRKLAEEQAALEDVLRKRQEQQAAEEEEAERNAPDRAMKVAWEELDRMKEYILKMEYTTDNVFDRHDHRERLYDLLDVYIEENKEYYVFRDHKDMELAKGTPGDQEYRYQDFVKTNEGKGLYELLRLVSIYRIFQEQIERMLEARALKKPGML